MISNKNIANVVGGKTARACDSCIKRRARWYCAADDAFLCQACDSLVHSANSLARRHERVRLKTSSLKSLESVRNSKESSLPSWNRWFTRKARTPRNGKPFFRSMKVEDTIKNPIPLVPEVGSEEVSHEDNEEEHLLYRVPIFEPFAAELCTPTTISNEAGATITACNDTDQTGSDDTNRAESKGFLHAVYGPDVEKLHGLQPSDMDLAEFEEDVESLLGRGLENESFAMDELGLVNCKDEDMQRKNSSSWNGKVKLENDHEFVEIKEETVRECHVGNETFELSFSYDSPESCGEEDDRKEILAGDRDSKNSQEKGDSDDCSKKKKKKKILLSLDYEAIISAWSNHGSPWTTGKRPDVVDPDECWPDSMVTCGAYQYRQAYGDTASGYQLGHPTMADGGREARVSRYREKRRTRLFSKKIRYEVRKLNAEKRPRMKGRFVKRASTFGAPAFPFT
ncbi:hypothetical protein K2173_017044 [Erythroxylum novogranatense]|uniref:Uncharacterized protein n=1 Tax=Erythroxylum novogranatense TaxID=1862640 RepID=A0AAV8U5R2_9ROSI|nr:hypothetical protein K2173_017044 [Erythroxylum novogranatense]